MPPRLLPADAAAAVVTGTRTGADTTPVTSCSEPPPITGSPRVTPPSGGRWLAVGDRPVDAHEQESDEPAEQLGEGDQQRADDEDEKLHDGALRARRRRSFAGSAFGVVRRRRGGCDDYRTAGQPANGRFSGPPGSRVVFREVCWPDSGGERGRRIFDGSGVIQRTCPLRQGRASSTTPVTPIQRLSPEPLRV